MTHTARRSVSVILIAVASASVGLVASIALRDALSFADLAVRIFVPAALGGIVGVIPPGLSVRRAFLTSAASVGIALALFVGQLVWFALDFPFS